MKKKDLSGQSNPTQNANLPYENISDHPTHSHIFSFDNVDRYKKLAFL